MKYATITAAQRDELRAKLIKIMDFDAYLSVPLVAKESEISPSVLYNLLNEATTLMRRASGRKLKNYLDQKILEMDNNLKYNEEK